MLEFRLSWMVIWRCGNQWRLISTSRKNTKDQCTVPVLKFWVWCSVELLGHVRDGSVTPRFVATSRSATRICTRSFIYVERDELLLKKPLGVLNDALAGRD